ncbi:hypothetical protein AWJ14_21465 [Hoeflea olei]|uniref:DUF3108 domain-containing protein n=2 Tax=Hoeflea olei TaxID=1480615 RepID=A0A1C1YXI2_9HYPH|nr:hypothetical protein AWJ14_21465 [Hoeflea olei]
MVLAACAVLPASAEPVRFKSEYKVTLIGFPVASARFVTEVDGAAYSISGDLSSSALSDIFAKTRGTTSVSGRLGRDRLAASRFLVAYTSGNKRQRTEISYRNGAVVKTVNKPEARTQGADWVPLDKRDLRSVVDPLSGMIFPAGAAECPRSLPVYDGESVATLHLTPIGRRPFSTAGFKGDAVVCAVRFEPNSGYRRNSSSVRYLTQLKGIEVWFARHAATGLSAPVYAKVPTKIGQVIVAATRFGG